MLDLALLIAAAVLTVIELVQARGRSLLAWAVLLVLIVLLLPVLPK